MKTPIAGIALSLITLSLAVILCVGSYEAWRPVPQCAEDVVLVGMGDFENGRWTSYVCGPAVDDFLP